MEVATVGHAIALYRLLSEQYPEVGTELEFDNAFQLLVATVLSAQTNDKQVNQVTKVLFRRFSTSTLLRAAHPKEIETINRPVGLYKSKAHALTNLSRIIEEEYGGTVPNTMAELLRLPGVGRKTANVVLGHGLNLDAFPVDRHVLRVCNRLGLTEQTEAHNVEAQVTSLLEPHTWLQMSDYLIRHGRRICKSRPDCHKCCLTSCCRYFDVQT